MKRMFSLLLALMTMVTLVWGASSALAAQQTIHISVLINGQQRQGNYTGEVIDGVPSGNGVFASNDNKPAVSYQGHWEKGQLSGVGHIEAESYTVHFDNSEGKFDRTGQFKGRVYNGLPSGNGFFSTKNSAGITWTYDGEWANGQFNGYGKQTWYIDDGQFFNEGNFENGDFAPTFSQLIRSYDSLESVVEEKSVEFIDRTTIFTRANTVSPYASYVNNSFNLARFKKKPSAYCDKIIKAENLQVIQVFNEEVNNLEVEYVLMEDSNGVVYRGLFDGSTDLVEDARVKYIWLLPLDWSTYENIYQDDIWSVYCAFTQSYEIMEYVTATITADSVYLRNANGGAIALMAKGATLDITGYDYSCNMFTATYGDKSGYVRGAGLSISKDELYSYFK